MGFDQALVVFTPVLLGLVAFVLALRMLRSEPNESSPKAPNAIGAVLLLFFAAGCLLGSFALWVCIGLSRAMH